MPEISIIVPVYKVEKYLEKCVDSILNQTFKDFELILVDDGSPDNCPKLCDEYAEKDNRVKVIHKENGGLSDARNCGIEAAEGKYIGLIDSDDYIAPDMYESLYNNLINNDADISVCGLYDCYKDKIIPQSIKKGFYEFNSTEALGYLLSGEGIGLFAVNKLYKKNIFSTVKYPENRLYEDAAVIVDILMNANKIVIDTTPKYYYLHRENSITISKFSKRYYDVVKAHERNLELIQKYFPSMADVGRFRVWWAYKQVLSILAMDDKENRNKFNADKREISAKIRSDITQILKNKYNSRSQKISYMLISFCPSLYMAIYRKQTRGKQ